jgi:uncharacterized repeat protein (TIGR03803 family)
LLLAAIETNKKIFIVKIIQPPIMKKKYHLSLLLLYFILSLSNHCLYAQGQLWGMTSSGGASAYGVIFKTNADGTNYTVAYNFGPSLQGVNPHGNLSLADNGKLYGMTYIGGSANLGVLFEFDPTINSFTKKIDFSNGNGSNPFGNLLKASNGKLYGMTSKGGTNNLGVIFEYDPATNIYTVKVNMQTSSGSSPQGSLMQASNGKLYGVTSAGGINAGGALFEYDISSNVFTKKFDFSFSNGLNPSANLIQFSNGKLYGTTYAGGTSGQGVLFEYDPTTSVYIKKIDFTNTNNNGYTPTGALLNAANGKLYGTTINGGTNNHATIFEFDPLTSSYLKKFDFATSANGTIPNGSLVLSNGKIYGMTSSGGANGLGVLFEYDLTTATFTKKTDFAGASGSVPLGSLLFDGKTNQTISFSAITSKTMFDPSFNLAASASSGLPVSYTSSNTSVATINGSQVTIVGAGSTTITASQSGNSSYYAAISVAQPFVVDKKNQSITFYPLQTRMLGDAPVALNATSSSALAITYSSTSEAVATISGNILTLIGAGTTNIVASQVGNQNYYAANDVSITLTVLPAGSAGQIWGTTSSGGASNSGVIFKTNSDGTGQTVQYEFLSQYDGNAPFSTHLTQAPNGKLYGLTTYGGFNGKGVLFEYNTANDTYIKKVDFKMGQGIEPYGSLTLGSNGKFYGMTYSGGASGGYGGGVIFEYDPSTNIIPKKLII